MEWIEVASADDDMIGGVILLWSGCGDVWDEHELDDEFSVLDDVLETCRHASVDSEVWEEGMPGQSGTWYTVHTDDPDALKREIRARVKGLIAELSEPGSPA